jgi:hypothetical protein
MSSMWLEENKHDDLFMAALAELKNPPKGYERRMQNVDTLYALCLEGPLDDGNVPSKQDRDYLVANRYAARISVKGEQGFNAATYRGNQLLCAYYDVDTLKEAKAERAARSAMHRMRMDL